MDKNTEISLLLDFYGELLSINQLTATDLYYNNDLSLSEIAQEIGITRQGVRDLIKRSEQSLYNFEQKLGLVKRFKQVNEGLELIKKNALLIIKKTDTDSIDENKILNTAQCIFDQATALQE